MDGVDIVHLHTVADWFDVPTWLERLTTKISVVISLHDMWHISGGCFLYQGCDRYIHNCAPCPILRWPFNSFMAKDEQRRKLHAYRERRVQFVANSQWLGDRAKESAIVEASGGVRVIPPGIDTTVFKPQDKAICRKELGLPADAFIIVTGGASLNDRNKNMQWLFDQLSQLPHVEGVIVLAFGEGSVPVPHCLNVRFTSGIQNRSDLVRLLGAADVFVSASLMESYGLTLVEAMACGTPVVAFRVGGIPEAAPNGRAAMLCAPEDGTALIEAIMKLRDSEQLRQSFGNAGHEIARTRNDPRILAQEFIRVYQECLRSAESALSARTPV
jgi:glycosyltransferase involved in cell wall biosynthesis